MKVCEVCGTENRDDAVTCVACGEGSFAGAKRAFVAGPVIAPAEEPAPVSEPEPAAPIAPQASSRKKRRNR